MSDAQNIDWAEAYSVQEASGDYKKLIPRKRVGSFSTPLCLDRHLAVSDEFEVGDQLLSAFGYDEFVGISNAESACRPIPEVFRTSDTDKVTDLVTSRMDELLSILFSELKAPYQSYTEVSRMGAPFYRPFNQKKWILKDLLPAYQNSDFSILKDAVVQIGVRIQPEPISKVRKFTFVNANGQVYKADLDRRKNKVDVWGHERYAGRTRQVFNQPIFNLLGQVIDTALNDVYGRYPATHHDMTRASALVKGPVLAFDVSHMERLTARIVYERSRRIGGAYFRFQEYIRTLPFLVPSDDWSKAFRLVCNYDKGFSVQFGSGNSAVAPSQKDIFMVLYATFAEQHLGIASSSSLRWAMGGGDERLRIFNYGDDNFIFSPNGDTGVLQSCFSFMSEYLTVSIEDPPKFLGYLYDDKFYLGPLSYLSKTYVNERGPIAPFRKFPYHGWVEKRKHYAKYGSAIFHEKLFPLEDKLLQSKGAPWARVIEGAIREQHEMQLIDIRKRAFFSNPNYLMDKADYLIGHEEKVKLGLIGGFTGFTPAETAPIIKNCIDQRWSNLIN